MMSNVQAKMAQRQAEIDRLTPLAKAERHARVAGIDNPWDGSIDALARAQAALSEATEQREAQVFADQVRQIEDLLERRAEAASQLAAVDAKIATYSEQTRDYFRAANDIMRWTDRATSSGPHFHTSATQRDAFGNVLDVPPLDHLRKPVVPDAEWPAVQEIRDLHNKRATIGQGLSGMDSSLRDMIAKNPALAKVVARTVVPV
jgi:hypothetical protein